MPRSVQDATDLNGIFFHHIEYETTLNDEHPVTQTHEPGIFGDYADEGVGCKV